MLKSLLQNKEIDIMIDTTFSINEDKDIIIKNLSEEKCCFAGKENLMKSCHNIEELLNLPLVLPSIGGNLRKIIDGYFFSNNKKVTPRIEAYTTETILSFVKKEYGIGFFFEKSIKELLDKKELVKFEDNNEIPTISLCYAYDRKNRNDLLKPFIDLLSKEEN